jgi:ABC-2 type transport system ATP-binding protein
VPSLEFEDAVKVYGQRTVVDDVTFRIDPGERVALLGRNGAGKTTVLRLALGLVRPTRGSCRLFDQPSDREAARSRIGYSPQENSLPDRLRVREIIRFVGDMKRVAVPEELIDRLEVGPMLHQPAGGLSLGQRRRVTLLLAFIGHPEMVILDEPTVSLDGTSRQAAWELIQDFTAGGGTLLLASHDFNEVATIGERVLVFVGGRLRADSTVSDLARSTGVTALEIPRTTDLPLTDISYVIHRADRTILLTRRPDDVIDHVVAVRGAGSMVQRRPTVEEVCLALGGGRGE